MARKGTKEWKENIRKSRVNQKIFTKDCKICKKKFICSPSHNELRKTCSIKCSNELGTKVNTGKTRFKNGHRPHNKGSVFINSGGYRVIGNNKKQIYEHHYVWCSQPKNLSYIPKGFCIHHLDGNRINNIPKNLVLMSIGGHTKLHGTINKLITGGKNL